MKHLINGINIPGIASILIGRNKLVKVLFLIGTHFICMVPEAKPLLIYFHSEDIIMKRIFFFDLYMYIYYHEECIVQFELKIFL